MNRHQFELDEGKNVSMPEKMLLLKIHQNLHMKHTEQYQ